MRRVALLCLVLLARAVPLDAQSDARRNPALDTLASDAAGLAPELAADVLIRIASAPRVNDRWKRELLDAAFIRAYGAHDPFRRSTPQPIPIDSRQGTELLVSAMSLNRLSLQVRAAQLMAYVDPPRARELFEWIDLDPAGGRCEDPLVPAVDEYYTALSLLARRTFRDHSDGLRFFELFLWRAHLPSEMPAVARAVQRFAAGTSDAAYLEGIVSYILETSVSDARGFSVSALDVVARAADLQRANVKAGLRGDYLMNAVREYLRVQLKAPRCRDSLSEPLAAPAFNGAVARAQLQEYVPPLDGESLTPSQVLGAARIDRYWQTSEAQHLHADIIALRGSGPDIPPLRVRQQPEWLDRAAGVLEQVEQWTGRREPNERDLLAEKSLLFVWLLELVPRSELRLRTIRSYVDFLRHEDREGSLVPLWFAFFNRLLELSQGDDREPVLAALANAHHPAMSVYGRLERLVPARTRQ